MNIAGHRELISYGRVLMFFKSVINLDDGSSEEVSLAYIEEFWEYIKHADSSLVGSGNVQLYAAQVYYVIPVDRILRIRFFFGLPTGWAAQKSTAAAHRTRAHGFAD